MTGLATPVAALADDIQQMIYDAASVMLYPVLIALLACLVWVLIEVGVFIYELVLRYRSRDVEALEISALRAREAFTDGKPRAAYRYLKDTTYSIVVTKFLFDLIRNYQTERLAAKPLKLLQEYEFYTVKRLERTRILTRIGPVLGLMGALIPLAPALRGLAEGDVTSLAGNLELAFSVAVLGLFVGGLAYAVSLVRDRIYSQDISDLEYLLEILEGNATRLESGRRRDASGAWEVDPVVTYNDVEEPAQKEDPASPAPPEAAEVSAAELTGTAVPGEPAAGVAEIEPLDQLEHTQELRPASFDDPAMSWRTDDDPFAGLGPVEREAPKPEAAPAAPEPETAPPAPGTPEADPGDQGADERS